MHTNDNRTGNKRLLWVGVGAVVAAIAAVAVFWPDPPPEGPEPAPRAPEERFADLPKIDVHTHLGQGQVDQALAIMDENGIDIALNASGGSPQDSLVFWNQVAENTDGRIRPYCTFAFSAVEDADFQQFAVAWLRACRQRGAVGLKIFKSLGLGIQLSDGSLLRIDDPRLDVVFETAGSLNMPVLIHSGDPQAFFRPATPDNERYAELQVHPHWSFHGEAPNGEPWPSWEEIFEQYEARVARHPETTILGAHFGNAPEEPLRVGEMLDRYPNLVVETGARIPEIGRHDPEEMRELFIRHQDRILFGTDLGVTAGGLTLGSRGAEPDPPSAVPAFFTSHFRYFETDARDMAHPTPIQGDWTIDGIGLPEEVLAKLYADNARRIFDLGEGTNTP